MAKKIKERVKIIEIQDIAEKDIKKTGKSLLPDKKFVIIAAVVLAIIAVFSIYKINQHNQHINYAVERVVKEILDCFDYRSYYIDYPVMEPDNYIWGTNGYFNDVKDNKKLANAIEVALMDICSKTGEFDVDGIGKVYSVAAVLEYLDYENPQVKTCIDSLTAQALEVVNSDSSYITVKNVYQDLMPFDGLNYYTGRKEMLQNEEIEAYYNARWQEVKQQMAENKDSLSSFIEDVEHIASAAPVKVPETIVSEIKSEYATAMNEVPVNQMYLDINKIMPHDELLAALQANGEPAVFRNGQGGYYDTHNIKGTTYGDFAVRTVSGRVRRTGQEDAFTEQYLRQHYDKPDKTYRYFRGEDIGALPPFFNDTRSVFVYANEAYAFTDYAVYYGNIMLPYDYEAAKEAEFKHVTTSQEEQLNYYVEYNMNYLQNNLKDFQPTYQLDLENKLITIYLTALPGTTAALQNGERIPFNQQGDRFIEWKDLLELLNEITDDMSYELKGVYLEPIGVALIMRSDVDPEAGLLSILNGEVVQDNSDNPPAGAETPETPENLETPENPSD